MQYQRSEKTRIEQLNGDLNTNTAKWYSNNISNYEYLIRIRYGIDEYSEGRSGHTSGAKQEEILKIKVLDGDTISVYDQIKRSQNDIGDRYIDSLPELFDFTKEVVAHPDFSYVCEHFSEVCTVLEYTPESLKSRISDDKENIPIPRIQVEFSELYGIPEFIAVYIHYGNQKYYHRLYLVVYEITNYKSY
jgi:hypothetical protein